MGLKDRLLEFIAFLGIEKSVFERNCGFSNGFVDKTSDNIRGTSLDKIAEVYPQLNLVWLRIGEGGMISPEFRNIPEEELRTPVNVDKSYSLTSQKGRGYIKEKGTKYNTLCVTIPAVGEVKVINHKGEEFTEKESRIADLNSEIDNLRSRVDNLVNVLHSKDQTIEAFQELVNVLKGKKPE